MPLHALKTCPRCDTALTGNESACPQCKRPLVTGPALVGAAQPGIKCPICKIPAYEATVVDQTVTHCAECQGTAFKREAVMKLQPYGVKELMIGPEERDHKRPPYFEPRKKPPFLICPFCVKRMREDKLGKTAVDICEACGALWLDGPKFTHLNDLVGPYKWRMAKAKDKPR